MNLRMTNMRLSSLALAATLLFAACDTDPVDVDDVSALQVIDLTAGSGATAAVGSRVVMHYTGWLYSESAVDHKGEKFDSSVDRGAPLSPFTLGTSAVIRGWDQGIPGMRVGGRRRLIIPSSLGYGAQGSGPIPGGSALVFDVELVSIQQ